MATEKTVLYQSGISDTIKRIAREIASSRTGTHDMALIGIQTRGTFLARRIEKEITAIRDISLFVGDMDINMYRDDWTKISYHPIVRPSNISFSVDDKEIILVDDVLFTGRTTRAAMDALIDLGRPARIGLAVLVDRGHRELPIQADYMGVFVNTDPADTVNVCLSEHDGEDRVYIDRTGS